MEQALKERVGICFLQFFRTCIMEGFFEPLLETLDNSILMIFSLLLINSISSFLHSSYSIPQIKHFVIFCLYTIYVPNLLITSTQISTHIYSRLLTSTQIYSHLLTSTRIYINLLASTQIYSRILASTHVYSHLLKFTHIYSHLLTSTRIYSHLHKFTHIYSHLLKSTCVYISVLSKFFFFKFIK